MTVRSILIGLALVILQTAITPYNDYYLQGTDIAGNHFPLGAVFTLIFLALLVNPIIKNVLPRALLNPKELIVIWVMMVVSSAIPSKGMIGFLLPYLAAPVYFATPENEWAETLHSHFPEWLIVWDKQAVTNFYEGESTVPWVLWIKPILVWSVFILLLYCLTICVSIVIRKQWVERERYVFPLVSIPVEMVQQTSGNIKLNGVFKKRLIWIGFGIAAAFHLLNGLHEYFPAIPSIPNRYDLYKPFTERPWIVMRWWPQFRFFLYFSVIGITYFLATEISFSCWFFFLFFKLQYIIINAFAIPISPWISARGQTMAAYVIMVIAFLINSRAHIKDIIVKSFQSSNSTSLIDDSNEVISYRSAFFGGILSFLLLTVLCVYAGMSFWVACSIIILFLIASTALSWMVVNGGMLLIQAPMYPVEYFEIITGSRIINANSLALLGFQRVMMRDWGGILMPSVLHGFKAADPVGLKRKSLFFAMAMSIVVAIGVSYVASLPLIYEKGGLNLQHGPFVGAPRYFNHMVSLIQYPKDPKMGEAYSMLVGAGITSFLLVMQRQFMWWQIHPIGYVMGAVYSSYFLWSCMFVGWLLKYLILKAGGIGYYRRLRPVFMGLIIGEFGIIGAWMVLGIFTGVNYHNALPG
ncbi:hypothetical protein JT359_08085 [Candidatus Poribacteria bacterium]|nr:hypothetical protein [Candidatus Poribacteria bacterium]